LARARCDAVSKIKSPFAITAEKNMTHRTLITYGAFSFVAVSAVTVAQAQEAHSILGTWRTENGTPIINVSSARNSAAARFFFGDIIGEGEGRHR
jgi:hypothetical protein